MQVFQQDDGRRPGCGRAEEVGQEEARPIVQLPGVTQRAAQVGAVAEIEAQQMPDEVRLHLAGFASPATRR